MSFCDVKPEWPKILKTFSNSRFVKFIFLMTSPAKRNKKKNIFKVSISYFYSPPPPIFFFNLTLSNFHSRWHEKSYFWDGKIFVCEKIFNRKKKEAKPQEKSTGEKLGKKKKFVWTFFRLQPIHTFIFSKNNPQQNTYPSLKIIISFLLRQIDKINTEILGKKKSENIPGKEGNFETKSVRNATQENARRKRRGKYKGCGGGTGEGEGEIELIVKRKMYASLVWKIFWNRISRVIRTAI